MNYKSIKNKEQLKELCRKRNLSDEGTVKDLKDRLIENDSKAETQIAFSALPTIDNTKQKDILFIQLKASNVTHYFNYGVLYPLALEESEIYKNENRKKDIFTDFQEYILLSEDIINSFEEEDVLLEVVTSKLPLEKIPDSPLLYTPEPIPLSRVKRILFKSDSSRKTFISSVKSFPDSFIPEEICVVFTGANQAKQIDINKINLPPNLGLAEWKIKLSKFDKIMGLFSFMKNAGVFFAEKDSQYQEYSSNYFTALSIINTNIKPPETRDVGLYRYILFPFDIEVTNVQRLLFRQISDTISNDKTFDLALAQNIIKEAIASELATLDEAKDLYLVLDYFTKLEKRQVAYKDLLKIEVIQKNYPVLALLFLSRFPNKSRQHTDKQAVRNTFISHEAAFSKSVSEYLLGILGLYYGYKTMIKEDTNLKLSDSVFSSFSEKQQSIKFRFLSRLDRITVESIFDFCKTGTAASREYPFLNFQVGNRSGLTVLPLGGTFEYYDVSYNLLETKVTIISRRHKADAILESIYHVYSENIGAKSQLLHYMLSNNGIDRKLFMELFKQQVGKLDLEEVQKLIETDKRLKNHK